MKLGTAIGLRSAPAALAQRARELESAGIDHFWTGEAYAADAVSTMGFLAAVTERAQIGSSILPLYSRTPTLLAMTAIGVDNLSSGRCILGLGASGPQVIEGFHGLAYDAPLQRTREIIDICRAVWRRDTLVHAGQKYQIPLPEGEGTGQGKPLKIMEQPLRDRIPIYVASLGPKNVEMTAELAEGWLPIHFWPEKASDVWADSIETGLALRDPALGQFQISAGGQLAIGDGLEELRERSRPVLTMFFGGMGARGANYYNDLLKRYGFESEAVQIQDNFLEGRRKEAAALVPQAIIDGTSLVGPESWVKERVAAYKEAGVTILDVAPVGPNGVADVDKVKEWLS